MLKQFHELAHGFRRKCIGAIAPVEAHDGDASVRSEPFFNLYEVHPIYHSQAGILGDDSS